MIRYIPFLKAKRGEITATGELAPEVKKAICPFFDFPRKGNYNSETYADKAQSIAASLKMHWGSDAEFYFDDLDIAQNLMVKGEHQYAYVLKALELQVIPVVALDRTKHNDAVTQLKRDGDIVSATVAFRAEQVDFEDFEAKQDEIDYDLAAVFNEFETIDLILDCRLCTGKNVSETAQQIATFAQKFCAAYDKVRRVIVTGSSIPAAIGDVIAVDSTEIVERRELEIIAVARDFSELELIAGDYASVSPFYSDAELDPRIMQNVMTPRLIYPFQRSHFVTRGISLKTGGQDQYVGLTTELCGKGFFRPGYSTGEDYFHAKSQRIGKNATNGTVVKPSVVAHITYMVMGAKS